MTHAGPDRRLPGARGRRRASSPHALARRLAVARRRDPVLDAGSRGSWSSGGRAVAVRAADGDADDRTRAVVADVVAPHALRPAGRTRTTCRARVARGMRALPAGPRHGQGGLGARRAGAVGRRAPAYAPGTVHVADSRGADDRGPRPGRGRRGARASPFLLAGQMTTTDPTRSPTGTESLWAYTHVPQRDPRATPATGGIRGRLGPRRLRAVRRPDAGADRAARAGLRLPGPGPPRARPARARGPQRQPGRRCRQRRHRRSSTRSWSSGRCPALGRAETGIRGLYLGSASAHPGGGVHGAPGINAARAALAHHRLRRLLPGR